MLLYSIVRARSLFKSYNQYLVSREAEENNFRIFIELVLSNLFPFDNKFPNFPTAGECASPHGEVF